MQEFKRNPILHRLDLSELVKAVTFHSSIYTNASLQGCIEESVSEGDTNILQVVEMEEGAFRAFAIEQSEALAQIRSEKAALLQHCGVDVELRPGSFDRVTWYAGTPEMFISNPYAFVQYLDAVTTHGESITTSQEEALRYVVGVLLYQAREIYRIYDSSDENSRAIISTLPKVHSLIEKLSNARPSFIPLTTEFTVLEWIVNHHCAAEVLSCAQAGGFSFQSLCVKENTLHYNDERERPPPLCASWYWSAEDVHIFSLKWRNLEQKVYALSNFPELKEFSLAVISQLKAELQRAKLDIIPNSSCLDAPYADLEFRDAIDEIYDRLSV